MTRHVNERKHLADHLRYDGFEVGIALSAAEAQTMLQRWGPDALVVDVDLPDASGIDLCRWVRSRSAAPLVLLTEAAADRALLLVALAAGADDVLACGGDPDLVSTRLTAMLHRMERVREDTSPSPAPLTAGRLTIDVARYEVLVDDRPIRLSPKEFELLRLFMSHQGEAVRRSAIIDALWEGEAPASNVVARQVRSLRHKLQPDTTEHRPSTFIETVPRVGYRLRAASSQPAPSAVSETRAGS
ncbi:MAG TPA: response regulator transcription factor [Candidatus Dormibacteraeota bacterium]